VRGRCCVAVTAVTAVTRRGEQRPHARWRHAEAAGLRRAMLLSQTRPFLRLRAPSGSAARTDAVAIVTVECHCSALLHVAGRWRRPPAHLQRCRSAAIAGCLGVVWWRHLPSRTPASPVARTAPVRYHALATPPRLSRHVLACADIKPHPPWPRRNPSPISNYRACFTRLPCAHLVGTSKPHCLHISLFPLQSPVAAAYLVSNRRITLRCLAFHQCQAAFGYQQTHEFIPAPCQ
jgi:hypothetical protein